MLTPRLLCVLLVTGTFACSSGHSSTTDGGPDGGIDAGPTGSGPIPAPLLRLDDGKLYTTHTTTYQGVVQTNQPTTQIPASLDGVTPADEMSVETETAATMNLYYTMPHPYELPFFHGEQIQVLYAELAAGPIAGTGSSYGVRVNNIIDGGFELLVEDGEYGSAFPDATDRLDFSFEPDTQPDGQEPDPCGTKVHYPGLITQGQQTKRLFPGQSAQFTVGDGGVVTFTLFDLWKITGDTCGNAPEYSISYYVVPSM